MGICRRCGSGCGPGSAPAAWSRWPWPWTPRCRTRPWPSTTSPPSSRCVGQARMGRWPPDGHLPRGPGRPRGLRRPAPPQRPAGRRRVDLRHPRIHRLCGGVRLRLAGQRRASPDRGRRGGRDRPVALRARHPGAGPPDHPTPRHPWPGAALARHPGRPAPGPGHPQGRQPRPRPHPPTRHRPPARAGAVGAPAGDRTVNADRPDPRANGTRSLRSDGHPASTPADPGRRLAGPVSTLDRVTLQLGVAVAVVIALCSYAVSATSLYALGVRAGYSWWQAAAVPVVADGPAIYGMFRIVSRSRRGAKGAGYGWLLVGCGTAASIDGNVAHAQPNLVAQTIAAAIPLAVLAMLEGLKGDAGEVTRLAAQAADLDRAGALTQPDQLPQATTIRRTTPTANPDTAAALGPQRRALPA